MNVILNCPDGAAALPALTRHSPLVLLPCLGATVLGHALQALAASGTRRVTLVASDRPAMVRAAVGRGEAWGMEVEVVTSTPGQASDDRVLTLDRWPHLPDRPLWGSYRLWQSAQVALMESAAALQVGMRQTAPGVFRHLRAEIAPDARLLAPCWIGPDVFIGPQSVIGPGSIVDEGSYIDEAAELEGSVVGPRTYVGAFTEVRDSFAWGSELLHLDRGSLVLVTDRFLLAPLDPPPAGWAGRLKRWWNGGPARSGASPAAGPTEPSGAVLGNLTAAGVRRG